MDKSIGIGIIIGLIVYMISVVSKSDLYSSSQKTLLYITLVLFFPLGLILTGILYLSNKSKL